MEIFTDLVKLTNVQKSIPELLQNSETETAENSDSCRGIVLIILVHKLHGEMPR